MYAYRPFLLCLVCLIFCCLGACGARSPVPSVPQAWIAIENPDLPQWNLVRDAEAVSSSFSDRGLATWKPYAAAQWKHLRTLLKEASRHETVVAVNAFFNLWPHVDDRVAWGVEEHWARPVDFINRGGDCEDYAIAKYYALRSLGFPAEKLLIAAVWNRNKKEPHAILIARVDDTDFALDNQHPHIRPLDELPQYGPYFYAVNEDGMWRPAPDFSLASPAPLF